MNVLHTSEEQLGIRNVTAIAVCIRFESANHPSYSKFSKYEDQEEKARRWDELGTTMRDKLPDRYTEPL